MYFKIALNNLRKSIKDYSIYFLTLTFAVCIFYSFNSIDSQSAILELNKYQAPYVEVLLKIISIISVMISFLLGGLIVYANNFLIKKRKKEFAVYMILGMKKQKVSQLIVLETFIVGVLSLLLGLIGGIILSQGLTLFTAKLFEANMSQYVFVFSSMAMIKTILYFSIIFILVMFINLIIISKCKLIDLLNSTKEHEIIAFKNSKLATTIFISGVTMILASYYLFNKNELNIQDIRFMLSIILLITGTVFVYYGLGNFILSSIKKNKKIYYKNLNIFVVKQLYNKISTRILSMTTICLMLFFTILLLSLGLSFKSVIEKGKAETTPFDASASMYIDKDSKINDIEDLFNKIDYKFNSNQKHIYFNQYLISETLYDILGETLSSSHIKVENALKKQITVMNIADYNSIKRLKGEKEVELQENEVLITSNQDILKKDIEKLMSTTMTLKINGSSFIIKNEEIISENFYTDEYKNNFFTLIVPNYVTEGLSPYTSHININYIGNATEIDAAENEFSELFSSLKEWNNNSNKQVSIFGNTRQQLIDDSKGLATVVLYIDIYLGLIFLVSSAALLALQQLSEASDSIQKYISLKKLGVSKKMIFKSIYLQVLIYFMVPLSLAIVHSVVGINIANNFFMKYGSVNILLPSIITGFILTIIYGGYLYATYSGYKNIIKNNL